LAVDGGKPVHHATDEFLLTISINPARRQLREVLGWVLANPNPRYRHVIYSGLTLSGTGCWLLSDGPFIYDDFVTVLVATKDDQHAPVYIGTSDDGGWSPTRLARSVPDLEVVLSPERRLASPPESFVERLSRCIGVVEGGSLLGATETVGSVSFARPTLYIFPGGDGGSSLFFGVRDLSVICDVGVGRRPAFWDLARHLSHVDVLIGTHAGADNVFGMKTFIERQCSSELQVMPKLGHVIFNGSAEAVTTKRQESPSLLVHLPEEIAAISTMLHDIGIPPQIGASSAGGKTTQKINLYYKINQGTLDLYVAHPVEDSRELKEFRRQCVSRAPSFSSQSVAPLTDMVSIVGALVWKPCALTEKLVRIFLPGSAPLAKVYEGLDRLQGLPLFESQSGFAEELPPRPTQHVVAKPGVTKPAAKPVGSAPKLPQQLAAAVKSSAPAKGRGQTSRSVTSPPKGNTEAASRRSTSKAEPASKWVRAPKPAQTTQSPSASVSRVKPATETAPSSKVQAPLKNTSRVDTELPAIAAVEPVHDVKVEEPIAAGFEELVPRDSIERDSLEASNVFDDDSLHGDDKDHSKVHSDDEIDPDKSVKVEKTGDGDFGELQYKDEDTHAGDVDVDDRLVHGLNGRTSPTLDVSSAGNHERVDPHGDLDTVSSGVHVNVVAERGEDASEPLPLSEAVHTRPADEASEPISEAVHPRPVDAIAVDVEASHAKEIGSDEVEDKQSAAQQETTQEIEPVEGTVHQDIGRECDDDVLSSEQQSAMIEPAVSDADKHAEFVGNQGRPKDIDVADTEGLLHGESTAYDGIHSTDLLADFQQSPAVHSTNDSGKTTDELSDQGWLEDIKAADTEVNQELKKDFDVDREAATADSGIIPQGLPSPQKEAEWVKTEQEDPILADIPCGETGDVPADHSVQSVDNDVALEKSAAAALSLTCEDDGEKMEHDHDVIAKDSEDRDELKDEHDDYQQNNGMVTVENDSTSRKPAEDATEISDLHSEVQHSDDNIVSTDLLPDQKAEDIAHAAADSNLQPEVSSPAVSDKLTGDTDQSPLEKDLVADELQIVPQEQSVPPASDSESHIKASDHVEQNEELPCSTATTDVFDEDRVPASPQQPMHGEYPVEIEPSSYDSDSQVEASDHMSQKQELPSPSAANDDVDVDRMPVSPKEQEQMEASEQPVHEEYPLEETEAHEQITDDVRHDTDTADTGDIADDVPVSPVEQSAQEDVAKESERTSFYYTEPQIRLSEDLENEAVMELPVAAADSAAGTSDGPSVDVKQTDTEDSSPAVTEEPFDPLQSWGVPMSLPAPLNEDESGKKRESKGDSSRAAAASAKDRPVLSVSRTDAKTSSGKSGPARDLSGGHTSARPGKSAERPAATRKPAAASADAKKVGIFHYQLTFKIIYIIEIRM